MAHSEKENVSIYDNSGLCIVLVFHRTKQYEEVFQNIVQPLSSKFRAHFAFVTIDRYGMASE